MKKEPVFLTGKNRNIILEAVFSLPCYCPMAESKVLLHHNEISNNYFRF